MVLKVIVSVGELAEMNCFGDKSSGKKKISKIKKKNTQKVKKNSNGSFKSKIFVNKK